MTQLGTDDSEGMPVVQLHGLGLDHRMWHGQVAALARAGYRPFAYDLLGHGHSVARLPSGARYTMGDMAEHVLAAMDGDGVREAAVVGFSLGGAVAQALALAKPDRVQALVLVATTGWMSENLAARFSRRADDVERHGMAGLLQEAIERWFTPEFAANQPWTVQMYTAVLRENDARGYAAGCRALMSFDVRSRLGLIRCPTLVVAGDHHVSVPVETRRALAAAIPAAQFCELGPAAHLVTEECREAVNSEILTFLANTQCAATKDLR